MNGKFYKTWNASAICRSIVLLIIGTCPQARGDVYLAPRWHANYAANRTFIRDINISVSHLSIFLLV